jgi:hypothetical protein
MSGSPGLSQLAGAALCVGAGGWMLVFQDHYLAARRRRHARDLAERQARGSDAWFEEQRSLRAYAPGLLPAWQRRLGGALMLLFGLAYLAMAIAGSGRP